MAETAPINQSQPEVLVSVDPSTLVSEEVPYTDDPTFPQRAAEQRLAESTYNAKARADARLRQMTQAKSDSSGGWAMLVLWPLAVGGCEKTEDTDDGYSYNDNYDSGTAPEARCYVHVEDDYGTYEQEVNCNDDYDGDGNLNGSDHCPSWPSNGNYGCPAGINQEPELCNFEAGNDGTLACNADEDGDGVRNQDDFCTREAGDSNFHGCLRDQDQDGIGDSEDECPNEPGSFEFNGCEDIDSDKDGISDPNDECPDEHGPSSNNGCPEPLSPSDSDNDGINDANDLCPNESGEQSNHGCPSENEPCERPSYKQCDEGDVYWFNPCDGRRGMAEDCDQGTEVCVHEKCVEKGINEEGVCNQNEENNGGCRGDLTCETVGSCGERCVTTCTTDADCTESNAGGGAGGICDTHNLCGPFDGYWNAQCFE